MAKKRPRSPKSSYLSAAPLLSCRAALIEVEQFLAAQSSLTTVEANLLSEVRLRAAALHIQAAPQEPPSVGYDSVIDWGDGSFRV